MKQQPKNGKGDKSYFQSSSVSSRQIETHAEEYLQLIDPKILNSFSPRQKTEILFLIKKITSNPAPKLVDLRFTIDLLIARYFVVILLGKDRRNRQRKYIPQTVSRIGNIATVIFILVGLNIFVVGNFLLGIYLLKSAVGISLFEGHISDVIRDFFN